MTKGRELEASYCKEVYSKDSYFELTQLQSQIFQILGIRKFKPKKILEIGIGSGFTSLFLKRAGYDVTTVDINENLQPDVCCDIANVNKNINPDGFDLSVCCQVLEHIPFDEFEGCIKNLSLYGNLYLTLPNYYSYFGFSGILRLPHVRKIFSLYFRSPFKIKKLQDGIHFWEVDSHSETSRKKIVLILLKYFSRVEVKIIPTNPYHLQFFCHK